MKTQTIWLGLYTTMRGAFTEISAPGYTRMPVVVVDGVGTTGKVNWPAAQTDWGTVTHVGIFLGARQWLGPVWQAKVSRTWVEIGDTLSFDTVYLEPELVELIEFLKGKGSMADLKVWLGLLDNNYDELKGAGYDRIQVEVKDGVCRHPAVVFPPATENWGTAVYLASWRS